MTNTKVRLLMISLAFLPLLACSNEFVDKTPESQSSSGPSLELRLEAEENFDERLQRLELIGKKIREVIKLFRGANRKVSGGESYTLVDLILDVNEELKSRPVEFKDGKFIRNGHVKLRIKELTEDCRTLETRIETVSLESKVDGEKADGLFYSVRTCHTSEYLPILQVAFTGNQATMDFKNENIKQALDNLLVPAIQANSNCNVRLDGPRIGAVTCNYLVSRLDEEAELNFTEITFDQKAETPFFLSGFWLVKKQPQAVFELSIDRRFTIRNFKFDPVPIVPN